MTRRPNSHPPHGQANEDEERLSPSEEIVRLVVESGAEFFHSPEREPFLSILVNGHSETIAIGTRQSDFRDWLGRLYYEHSDKVASEATIREAATVLAGIAKYRGAEYSVFVRVAEHEGCVYVDLANENWQAVKISTDGWTIVDSPPVKFKRTQGMQTLPPPIQGGSVDQLRALVNVGDDDQWALLVAWLVAALRPTGPTPFWSWKGAKAARRVLSAKSCDRS